MRISDWSLDVCSSDLADIGAAELEPDAERLSLAHHDIGAHFAGRLNQAERDRFGDHRDQQRTGRLARGGARAHAADASADVRILDEDAVGVIVDRGELGEAWDGD